MNKKLTEEDVERALMHYKDGLPLEDLAHLYRVSRQVMWNLLKYKINLTPQKR